jgi:lipoyl(octanoyl) transferase
LISLVQLGTVDYATGLRLQEQLVALRKEEKIGDVLLLLEHPPVITLGRNAKAANVIASPELLERRAIELFECDRGGDVTFHGPGQIVGYPIFDVRGFANADGKRLGVVEFVRRLEEVLIRTCVDFAIPTKRVAGLTGVWTDPNPFSSRANAHSHPLSSRAEENDSQNRSLESRDLAFPGATTDDVVTAASAVGRGEASRAAIGAEAKIAAIGVHISRFVTSHGFALNVNTDLSYFKLIVPCGITAKPVTSMQQELSKPLDLNAVAESISRNFGVVFQSQILWVETLDALLGSSVGVPMQAPKELRRMHREDETTWA